MMIHALAVTTCQLASGQGLCLCHAKELAVLCIRASASPPVSATKHDTGAACSLCTHGTCPSVRAGAAHEAMRGGPPSLGVSRTSRGACPAEFVCQLAPHAGSSLVQPLWPCSHERWWLHTCSAPLRLTGLMWKPCEAQGQHRLSVDCHKRQANGLAGCKQGCEDNKKAVCTCPRTSTVFTPVMPAACSQKLSVGMRRPLLQAYLHSSRMPKLPGSGVCRLMM